MALDASDALTQIIIFAGVVLGVAAWTIWQYLKTQQKFQDVDIEIIFNKKFIATAIGALVTAFVLVAGSYNSFLDKIIAQDPATYIAAFFGAFGLGFTFNAIGNQLIPSPANPEAERKLMEKKAEQILEKQGITKERLENMMKEDALNLKKE